MVFRKQGLLYGRLSSLGSVVNVMLDAVQHYDMPLSKEKLCAWQAAFFPSGYSEG
jgi:hypothetical protein